jgi:DNA-binding transcriptional regulator YdaS (Cro superfamily)
MKLIDYLNAIPVEARDSFAARCGTSFNYLRQVGYGNRPCPEKLAINLERESNRILLCEELCPEADWAFIRSTTPPSRRRAASQPQ